MNLSSLTDFLSNFETGHVVSVLREMDVGRLIHNPWFLGAMGALALIALVMKWRVLLATILSVTGFVGLISYTLRQGAGVTGLASDTLLVFVGGGVALIFLVIYLLFIKTD